MSTELTTQSNMDDQTILQLVAGGDTSRLTPQQKLTYYRARCEAAGLDPRTHPFEFTKLQGKETLYARKAASDQLAAKNGIRFHVLDKRVEQDLYVVTGRVICQDGREMDDIGAVAIKGKTGDELANAMMKALTKCRRRAVLSVCGLGVPDETELETVPRERVVKPPTGEIQVIDFDPVTGEVHDGGTPPASSAPAGDRTDYELKASALIARIAQIANEFEKKAWTKKHWDEIADLKNRHPDLYAVVKSAHDKSPNNAASSSLNSESNGAQQEVQGS